ncbi:unnamed protein product, partial [Rotaria sp. Silwood1]
MRQLTKEYRIQAMSLYLQAITREKEILKNEIELVMKAFKHYNDLCEKRFNLEGFLAPTIINEAQVKLTEEEYQLLKLGPRFIYNDPQTASRRRTTELAMLKLEQFIAELDIILKNLHDTPISKINRKYKPQREIISYDNLLETIQLNQYQITKCPITTEKKIMVNYKIITKKSDEYMEKTEAYKCLHQNDPLPSLIDRTNKYLLNLRLSNWITQKQYEQLSIKSNEVELTHLYYLPKAQKPGTPLHPIISGLKHPTKKISKFLDELLRPLFNKMASNTTVTCGTEVIKQLHEWSKRDIRQETLICTMDVMDLYTMISQTEGIMSIKKLLDYFKIKKIVRGGAMGSPLILTIANCYMYFYERDIVKQVNNSNGLYLRNIDDIFIIINWPIQHLSKQINR